MAVNGAEQRGAVSVPFSSSACGVAFAWLSIPDSHAVPGSADRLEESSAVGEIIDGVEALFDPDTVLDVSIHDHVRVRLVDSFHYYLLIKAQLTLGRTAQAATGSGGYWIFICRLL